MTDGQWQTLEILKKRLSWDENLQKPSYDCLKIEIVEGVPYLQKNIENIRIFITITQPTQIRITLKIL